MLPLILVNVVVILIPSLSSVYYSFTDWSGIGDATFIGLDNCTTLLGDPEFTNALWHNVLWTAFFLVVPMAMGLFGAYALTRVRRFRLLFRVAYFIPYIVASVVSASIWRSLLSPDAGVGTALGINLLGDRRFALGSVAFVNNWAWWGFLVVVFLAAMQSTPEPLRSGGDGRRRTGPATALDHPAGDPTDLRLPRADDDHLVVPVLDYVYILTQGGPACSTDVLSTLLYRNAFTDLHRRRTPRRSGSSSP